MKFICAFLIYAVVTCYASEANKCGDHLSAMIVALCNEYFPELQLLSNETDLEEHNETLTRIKRGIVEECCVFTCTRPSLLEYCDSFISPTNS